MIIDIDGIEIELTRKRIRTMRLTIKPPLGEAQVSAPLRTSMAEIRSFLASRTSWIRKHRERMLGEEPEPVREYREGEPQLVWGRQVALALEEIPGRAQVRLEGDRLLLRCKPDSTIEARGVLIARWYRRQIEAAVPPLAAEWEALLGVRASAYSYWQMKTRWGSCNARTAVIRLNIDLARKPIASLEYVLVHELVHLLEASHGPRFKALMDRFMPDWRSRRKDLNRKAKAAPEDSSNISLA